MAGAVRVSRREAVRSVVAGEGLREGYVVGGAVVVDVVGAEDGAGELLQQVGLFVGEAVAADDADGAAAAGVAQLARSFLPTWSSATSQLTGLSSPLGWRTSGWVMRSAWLAKSNA